MYILTSLKNMLYDWLIRSHVMFYLSPILAPLHFMYLVKFAKSDLISDDAGNTMRCTKYKGRVYPLFGEKRISTIKDIRIRDDDIMLCSYPKTGTHFAYEVLYMLRNGKAKLSPYGKGEGGMVDALPDLVIDSIPSPRILNSHLLYEELPVGILEKKSKIVLTIRCPKDTAVSFFNHTKSLDFFYKYEGKFDDYFGMFMKGQMDYGCYFDYYQTWDKVMKMSKDENSPKSNPIFLLSFEELKENPVEKIKELADFLEISITSDLAEEIAKATSFTSMKKNRKNNLLMRKGEVGDWKNWLTDEQKAEVDVAWRNKMVDFRMGAMKDGYKKTLSS